MTVEGATLTGRILHLQRLSTEDGPGIRTTVFFKGCPLACAWCHNPESIAARPQVQWLEQHCIACRTCLETCPRQCLTMTDAGVQIDRACCDGCGSCAAACPANAMELLGKTVSVNELTNEVAKDRAFFETSGGGVTLSGGEPTMQPAFATALMRRMHELGIATALDTCGLASRRAMEQMLPHVDLLLFDLKEIDPQRHLAFTGQRNEAILEMLDFVHDLIGRLELPTRLWIRTPLIPAATATGANVAGIGAWIAGRLNGRVERWDLCAFNNLCRDKYRRLGLDWTYQETPLLAAGELAELAAIARRSGVDPAIVVASGATRSD